MLEIIYLTWADFWDHSIPRRLPTGEKRFNEQDWKLIKNIKSLVKNLPDLEVPPEECFIILETDGYIEGWGGVCKWKKHKNDPRNTEKIKRKSLSGQTARQLLASLTSLLRTNHPEFGGWLS